MIKTTPPGEGSRLLRLRDPASWRDRYVTIIDGVELMRVGDFTEEDYRKKCFHSKTGAIESWQRHLSVISYFPDLASKLAGVSSTPVKSFQKKTANKKSKIVFPVRSQNN